MYIITLNQFLDPVVVWVDDPPIPPRHTMMGRTC